LKLLFLSVWLMSIPTGTPRCLRLDTLALAKGDYDDYPRVYIRTTHRLKKKFGGTSRVQSTCSCPPPVWIGRFNQTFFIFFGSRHFSGTESLLLPLPLSGLEDSIRLFFWEVGSSRGQSPCCCPSLVYTGRFSTYYFFFNKNFHV
jgi:hypothetical protein